MDFVSTDTADVVEGIGSIAAVRSMPLHPHGEKKSSRKNIAAQDDGVLPAEDGLTEDTFTHEEEADGEAAPEGNDEDSLAQTDDDSPDDLRHRSYLA